MAFCQNCGQQFPDGTPQCPNCGMPMMQQPVYQQNPYPNQQQFAPNMNMQQPKKKGKGVLDCDSCSCRIEYNLCAFRESQ